MKKLAVVIIISAAASIAAAAQPRAIGGRLGYGIGLSYQHGMGSNTLLQMDLDYAGFSGIQLMGTYNGVLPISSNEFGDLNFLAGGGIGGGYGWSYLGVYSLYGSSYSWGYGFAGVAGQLGIEYNFKASPLQLFADFRPLIGLRFHKSNIYYGRGSVSFHTSGLYSNTAVGVRFQLGGGIKSSSSSTSSRATTSKSTGNQKTATVTRNVNFRKGPSTSDAVIRQLQQGDIVTLTGAVSGSWTQVTFNGVKGWVSTDYLKK